MPVPSLRLSPRWLALPALAALTLSTPRTLTAQTPRWVDVSAGPWPVSAAAMTNDPVRGAFVLYGGADAGDTTWLLHGARWRAVATAERPAARTGHAMAFDGARGVTVLFGGADVRATFLDETWTFDGASWRRAATAFAPPPRVAHRLAFHAATGEVVLCGGNSAVADTWTWDGTAWTQRNGAQPPRRSHAGLAYDAARGRTVLFGGWTTASVLDDLWEWDGAAWSQPPRAGAWPPARHQPGFAFDATAGRCFLFGGFAIPTRFADAWHWDGAAWTVAQGPGLAELEPALAGDANGRLAMVGPVTPRTWLRENGTWRAVGPERVARSQQAMAVDPLLQSPLLFGGNGTNGALDDTLVHDGHDWLPLQVAVRPGARFRAAMAPFPARSSVVLFGGQNGAVMLGDTWEWSAGWTRRTPATSPPPRSSHRLATDPVRGRVVMFGGMDAAGFAADTWEWDGITWRSSGGGPPVRMLHAMAFDPNRGRIVLYGGQNAMWTWFDTWEWDGASWTLQSVTTVPESPYGVLAYEPHAGALHLFAGGNSPGSGTVSQWEYTGGQWAPRGAIAVPFTSLHGGAVTDPVNGRVLFHDGRATWATVDVAAVIEPFGSGCVFGVATPPSLGFLGRPSILHPDTSWRVDALAPNAVFALFADVQRAPLPPAACLGWLPNPVSLAFALASPAGSAEVRVVIPNRPALVGAEVFTQAAGAGPNGLAAGIGVSAGLRVRVGS